MAAGIGGRTIAEAKRNLTLHELHLWRQYHAKGLIVSARTVERAAALVAMQVGGGKFSDYLPDRGDKPEVAPLSAQQAMALMPGTVIKR